MRHGRADGCSRRQLVAVLGGDPAARSHRIEQFINSWLNLNNATVVSFSACANFCVKYMYGLVVCLSAATA